MNDASRRHESDNEPPIKPGTVIDGKFRVEAVLGEGGMGVVVRAMHLKLQSPVAIKFLLREALADRVVVERFRREAQMSARLTSENVARVLDVGTLSNGAPYMVMEYLQGETLLQVLDRRKMIGIQDACNYMMQCCEALTEAHSLGFVHRDLKPGNLFLVTRPNKTVVKLLDFGISKLGGMSAPTTQSELTMTSMVLGTPSYMAPEQLISSRTVDARADIWSCGVVLFRMLTGELPYDADSLIELGVKLMNNDPPDMRRLRPELPSKLIAIVRRCLEREADDRFPSARELSRALEPFASSSSNAAAAASYMGDQRAPTGSAPTLLASSDELQALPSSRGRFDEAPPSSDEEARVTIPKMSAAQPTPVPVLVPDNKLKAFADTVPKPIVMPAVAQAIQSAMQNAMQQTPSDETRVASPQQIQQQQQQQQLLQQPPVRALSSTPASLHAVFMAPQRESLPPARTHGPQFWFAVVSVAFALLVVVGGVVMVQAKNRRTTIPTTTTTTTSTVTPTFVPVADPVPTPIVTPAIVTAPIPSTPTSVPSTRPSASANTHKKPPRDVVPRRVE